MGKIKDLPLLERPREKAIRYGISSLSNAEILAIIIGSGTRDKSALDIANELLSKYNGLDNLLRVSQENLTETKGISIVSALRICACFTFAKKIIESKSEYTYSFEESYKHIVEKYRILLSKKDQEELHVISLNQKGKIIKEKLMYIGTETTATVSVNEVLKQALLSRCKNLILIHNHPNGLNQPSDNDLIFTRNLIEEGKRFHLKVYDHIIIGPDWTYSMFDRME